MIGGASRLIFLNGLERQAGAVIQDDRGVSILGVVPARARIPLSAISVSERGMA
jgi:hypothetical protein